MSEVKEDKSDNGLKRNDNPKIIFNLLNTTKTKKNRMIAWKILGNSKISAELSISTIKKFNNELVLEPDPQGLTNLKQIVAGTDLINVYLVDDGILFQSHIKSFMEDSNLIVGIPKLVAQVERRRYIRLIIREKLNCSVNFFKSVARPVLKTQAFEKKCYDIGAGGLSFLVTKMEERFFKVGDEILGMKITVDGEKLEIDGKVVNIVEVSPNDNNNLSYKAHKICIGFTNASIEQKEKIGMFVFKYVDNVREGHL